MLTIVYQVTLLCIAATVEEPIFRVCSSSCSRLSCDLSQANVILSKLGSASSKCGALLTSLGCHGSRNASLRQVSGIEGTRIESVKAHKCAWGSYPLSGNGGTVFAPVKSVKFCVLPAALPAVGIPWVWQTAKWSGGIVSPASSWGASTIVAIRPMTTCHSIWQWNSQTPGFSAWKRITA